MSLPKPKHQQLEDQWNKLRLKYLPYTHKESIWAYSFKDTQLLPDQGWKLHISATICNANALFKIVAPILTIGNWHYKAPHSLTELKKINSGLFYGYSQIGKFITIYLRSKEDLLDLVNVLQPLTKKFKGPTIPSDKSLPTSSCLFYRYGCFKNNSSDGDLGNIIDPDGRVIPDRRERKYAVPSWLVDPFENSINPSSLINRRINQRYHFLERYRPFKVLSQRGKGGVYLALDFNSTPFRICILKEGRKGGELDWAGFDGLDRVQQEVNILKKIENLNINAPQIIDSIKYHNHAYIAMDYINGVSLDKILYFKKKKLPIDDALHIAYILACSIEELHKACITWRDIKPANIIIDNYGSIHLIDFEGALEGNTEIDDPWGSPGYVPPEWLNINNYSERIKQDIFAFGATLRHMLSGLIPNSPLQKTVVLRKYLPTSIKQLINRLTSDNPELRPTSYEIKDILLDWKELKVSDSTMNIVNKAIIEHNSFKILKSTK